MPPTTYQPGQRVLVRGEHGERPGEIFSTTGEPGGLLYLVKIAGLDYLLRVRADQLRPAPDPQLSLDHGAHADELRIAATQLEQLANGFDHVAALAGSMGRSARNEVARIQRLALELGGT